MKTIENKLVEYISPVAECFEIEAPDALCETSWNPPGSSSHFEDDWF